MPRFFLEVAYKGTKYAGFQIQQNANTIQAEIEKALSIYFRTTLELTGSSRTDSGVHALQNFYHFDFLIEDSAIVSNSVYRLNSILPHDIVIKSIYEVSDNAHCRFNAVSRLYEYTIYNTKDPFLNDRAYYYPYPLNLDKLNEAAAVIKSTENFKSFSKKNTQVQTYLCNIEESIWFLDGNRIIYKVKGNRFLRGMVKGLVGTMLKMGTGKIDLDEFKKIVDSHNCSLVDFSAPSHGLILVAVGY
jgi:tRNA pseudouridine38-40 synthase